MTPTYMMYTVMQLVVPAFSEVKVFQYTVAGATMILFSLQCDKLFLALCFVSVHAIQLDYVQYNMG